MGRDIFNTSHYLLGVRFDNWLRLLWENRFRISPRAIPQALYITGTSLLLFPFALLEAAIFALPIKRSRIKKGPVYIIGHWRSGTTYLQNLMSKDKKFGWFDPVSTATFSNCTLLRPLLAAIQKRALKKARPMDNMEYKLDLPMEEAFALATISPLVIIQMISFPQNFKKYLGTAFLYDLTPSEKREWYSSYDYILRKLTYINKGKPLLLKSPDNTCRVREIKQRYPNAKFVNIYREPYTVVMSTINMFIKQMDLLALQERPERFEELIEDTIVDEFERMYRELFETQKTLGKDDFVDVCYETFAADPEKELERIYGELGLPDFDAARIEMEKHIESQKDYKKNRFTLSDRLRRKINARLGFYFEHYGYAMEE